VNSALARIALRYIVGFIVARGILPDSIAQELTSDPEVLAMIDGAVGLVAAASIELWYKLAKKFGWAT